jgi:hypothetical protein
MARVLFVLRLGHSGKWIQPRWCAISDGAWPGQDCDWPTEGNPTGLAVVGAPELKLPRANTCSGRFNPKAAIAYLDRQLRRLTIQVRNNLGQLVRTLPDGHVGEPGCITWRDDDDGNSAAPGVSATAVADQLGNRMMLQPALVKWILQTRESLFAESGPCGASAFALALWPIIQVDD